MYTGQLDLKGKFDTGFISHQVLIGGEYEDATSNGGWTALNGVPAMDALNPTYLSTQLTPGKAFVFRNDKRIGSFYFQDMMAITDKFDLFGGVRQSNVAGSKLAANGAATQYDLDNKSFQVGGATTSSSRSRCSPATARASTWTHLSPPRPLAPRPSSRKSRTRWKPA